MRVEAFVVHLRRAADRREQAERLLSELPVPSEIVDAVDGLELTPDDIASVYHRDLHAPRYPFDLRRQEIGVFLSHRKIWQAIVDRRLDFGLVVEDDVRLEPGFAAALSFAVANASISDYVRFPRWLRGEQGSQAASDGAHALIVPRLAGLGMQAELIGPDAAERLLRFTERFDRPVDTTIQMTWLHGVRVLSLRPIVIEEIDYLVGGTTIQGKSRRIGDILFRELNRALYRARVTIDARRAG